MPSWPKPALLLALVVAVAPMQAPAQPEQPPGGTELTRDDVRKALEKPAAAASKAGG